MSDTLLAQFATEYARKTGCDQVTAQQASFVMATLLADAVGRKDLGDYFSGRASEMEGKGDGQPLVKFQAGVDLRDTERIVPANEAAIDVNRDRWGWY